MGEFFYQLTYWDKMQTGGGGGGKGEGNGGHSFEKFFLQLKDFGMVFRLLRNRRFTTCALR